MEEEKSPSILKTITTVPGKSEPKSIKERRLVGEGVCSGKLQVKVLDWYDDHQTQARWQREDFEESAAFEEKLKTKTNVKHRIM